MGTQTYSDKKQRKREKTQKQLKKMSVQVKAILHRGPNEEELPRKEIRRFEVDANVARSYDFLRAKIIALYPDLAEDSAFRLMWTDDEGDNVCFSTDEEYAQALKFANGQENKLFEVMIKMPATMGPNKDKKSSNEPMSFQEGVNTFAHHAQHFGEAMHTAFNPAKMAKKCEKMKAKQEFHESKAKQLNNMLKSINPQMHHHIHTVAQQMAQMNNDSHVTNVQSRPDGDVDISVDIPINHNSTTTTTTTTNNGNKTVYPDLLEKNQMEEDFIPVSSEDATVAKLNEAMNKMKELGFEVEWIEALLKSVDCDVARAVDKLNPRMN